MFWFRLADKIFFDLFLYVHINIRLPVAYSETGNNNLKVSHEKNISTHLQKKAPGKIVKTIPGFFKGNSITTILIAMCIEIDAFFMQDSKRRSHFT